ncbi:hypothetical protein GCM10023216_08330 [Isoptericola chiayiensis]|uniref:ATP/GTP-binding protein n=1 Tax=Isoptericola chiayiensis TaxID=579446 RepID=A0ABP8Y6D9_9MICO|nr:hypothetical protein [Isoptericola chiayiensis]NOV99208.1 hypothetical protein [Isoptericola chiayiensis]
MPSRRPSRKRPWNAQHQPLDLDRALGGVRHVSGGDGEWTVRRVKGGDKAYTCPACHQTIPPGTAHVVAWQRDVVGGEQAGLEARRHWHRSCFDRRERLL